MLIKCAEIAFQKNKSKEKNQVIKKGLQEKIIYYDRD